jgi:folate-binding protein YgfZ
MKDLEHLRILTISGEDAGELLQGQMTQDVRKLEDEKIHITSFCNVQGRVIASAFIQERNDQYDLILSSEIIDDLENHLQRYILRSKVLIEQSDEKTFGAYKSDINEDSKECRSLKNDPKRVLTLSSQVPESIDNFITSEEWIRCDIENSIAIINKESTEKFIPQMLNLDILDAVSFSKGCYTGQEVVARVQHRGKIKQRMFKFKTENEDLISHGSEIQHESKKVGTVVISELIDNYSIGLAVINSADNESQLNIGDINIKLL